MKKIYVLFTLLLSLSFTVKAQNGSDLNEAFKKGNAKTLSEHFGDQVDLVITDDESVVNKPEGRKKLTSFFSAHKPTAFKVLHSGESNGGMQYTIGLLSTDKGAFRISYYVKNEGDNLVIRQMMIEAD